MKDLIFTALFFFISKTAFSQNDIFEIAKKGTVDDIIQTLKDDPNSVNKINKEGFTPLVLACYKGNNQVADYLINILEDVNISSDLGPALIACAIKGNNAMAKLLLEKMANPNIKDSDGNTALIYAVQFKNIELVALLLSFETDKALRNNLGKTAFEYAAFSNDVALMDLLS